MLTIRTATGDDWAAIWRIFRQIIEEGDTYVNDHSFTEAEGRAMWLGPGVQAYVVCDGERVVGAYKLLPNMPGRGAHVANGSYIIDADQRGRGIGHRLVEHSIEEATKAGYRAIQFNCVVSTNRGAVKLYERYGFRTLATLPQAFRHPTLGYVDAYLMHRSLVDDGDSSAAASE
jgi:L-amino acid N-acyltransferase YncA